jgi:hypothetical protein
MNKLLLSISSILILIMFSIFLYFAIISGEMYVYINLFGVVLFGVFMYFLNKEDSSDILPFHGFPPKPFTSSIKN